MSFFIGLASDASEVTLNNSSQTVWKGSRVRPIVHGSMQCGYPSDSILVSIPTTGVGMGVIFEICSIGVGCGIVRLSHPYSSRILCRYH